jgi:hypothetical protein
VLVRQQNYGPGDPELLGQIARRWQALARANRSAQNRLANASINLPEQRLWAVQKWYHKLHKKWLF